MVWPIVVLFVEQQTIVVNRCCAPLECQGRAGIARKRRKAFPVCKSKEAVMLNGVQLLQRNSVFIYRAIGGGEEVQEDRETIFATMQERNCIQICVK